MNIVQRVRDEMLIDLVALFMWPEGNKKSVCLTACVYDIVILRYLIR